MALGRSDCAHVCNSVRKQLGKSRVDSKAKCDEIDELTENKQEGRQCSVEVTVIE